MFTTERLRLRAYDPEKDLPHAIASFNNLAVSSSVTNQPIAPRTPKYVEEIFKSTSEQFFFAVIETLDGGDYVGNVVVRMDNPRNRDGRLGIALIPEHWNKGFGRETITCVLDHCFRMLGLHRMSLTVFESNAGGRALYRKLGFVEEGRIRQARFVDGGWEDEFVMGVLASEWMNKTSVKS